MDPGDYVEGPRHAVVTNDNVGPIITILALFFMVVMVLAVALRLLVRFTTSNVPGADDAIISVALVMALGEVIAICLTVNQGLGTQLALITPTQLPAIEKGIYATDFLYVLTIALAKTSSVVLLLRLTISRHHQIAMRTIIAVITAWTIAAVFGVAFQCDFPDPWATKIHSNECFNIVSFWNAIGTVDIILDVALIAMPAWIIWSLQMPVGRKAMVIMGFGFRLLLCAAQILRLVYLQRYSTGHGPLFSSLGYTIATQFETMFSVIVACIPAFKPFMDRAASGLIGISFKDRGGTYELSSIQRSANSQGRKHSSGNGSRSRRKPSFLRPDGDYHAEISAASRSNSKAAPRAPGNSNLAVQRTVEWEVHYSDQARLNDRQNWHSADATAHDDHEASPTSASNAEIAHNKLV